MSWQSLECVPLHRALDCTCAPPLMLTGQLSHAAEVDHRLDEIAAAAAGAAGVARLPADVNVLRTPCEPNHDE